MGPEEDGSSQEVQCWRQASRGWRRRRAAASMTQGASLASANTLGDSRAGWPHAPRTVRGRRTTTGKSQPVRLRYSVTCDAPPRTAPASCWQVATKQLPREADADVTHVKEAGDEAADGPLDADTRSDDAHAGGRDAVVAEATPTNAANVANVASARILTPARASTSAPPPRTTASDVTTPPRDERASTRRKSESLLLGSEARRARATPRSCESRPLRCVSRVTIARAANYTRVPVSPPRPSHRSPNVCCTCGGPRRPARRRRRVGRVKKRAFPLPRRLTQIFPRRPPHPLPRVPYPSTPRRRA